MKGCIPYAATSIDVDDLAGSPWKEKAEIR